MALDPTLLIGLKALELYLDDMVIAGGWVLYLFAAHEQPSAEAVALKTRDLDVAVSRKVGARTLFATSTRRSTLALTHIERTPDGGTP